MPEGDTIFRAARTLDRALRGHVVTHFESVFPHLTRVQDDQSIVGRTVESVTARGKHVLMQLSGGLVLRTHMRMSGTWHIYRSGEPWQKPRPAMRIVIATPEFVAVAFNVHDAQFVEARRLERDSPVGRLGPDLLSVDFNAEEALRRLRTRGDLEIGEALLNQRIMAGIGNVFKSEVLFLCGVLPFTRVADLHEAILRRTIETARAQLAANVLPASGDGIVTYAGLRRTTRRADPAERLWVYGRRGQPCRRCGRLIEGRKQGPDARITYWCPECQHSRQEIARLSAGC